MRSRGYTLIEFAIALHLALVGVMLLIMFARAVQAAIIFLLN